MKNKFWILFSFIVGLFASCQQEELNDETSPYNQEITIQASITPMSDVETRASFDHTGDGKGTFNNGDQIAVYITPENGKTIRRTATLKDQIWTFDGEKLNWGDLKASKAVFSAYYPAISTPVGEKHILKCEVNQTFNGNGFLEKSDQTLLSSNTVNAGEPVTLKFHHAMHFLEVNLSSMDEKITSKDLQNATVYVKAYTEMGLDPATGKISALPGKKINKVKMNNFNTGSNFRAVICPQPILEQWRKEGWLEITVKSNPYKYNAPSTDNHNVPFESLESGKRFKVNLLVADKDDIIEDLTDQTVWVTGLKNIPRQTTWGFAYKNMRTLGLKYEQEYGWYDVKKRDAINPTFDDHRLCWAAATSNMLHWWYDRNKENVECYIKYKKATDPNYIAPNFNYDGNTHKDSDIFNFFKRTCVDKGGYVSQGVKWYLRGDWIYATQNDASSTENNEESRKHQSQGGFFGEVYQDAEINEMWQGQSGSYEASKFIKAALERGDALGIDHQSMDGSHAITLWGAAFDKNGEVTTLYVCDNNHTESELQQGGSEMIPGRPGPFGIFQMRIKRDAPNSPYYHLESSTMGTFGVDITGLESISQGKAAWDRFWAKHPEYAPKKK